MIVNTARTRKVKWQGMKLNLMRSNGTKLMACDLHYEVPARCLKFWHCTDHKQDPMSHRIIEKRRRDRMNNCLADLSRLIPTEYLKKGRGRIEKTEIIEMAIKHMKHLQSQDKGSPLEHYRLGYQECMSETMRFMVEVEGHFPREPVCVRLLNHLQKHCEQISKGPNAFPTSPVMDQVPSYPTVQMNSLKNINISPPQQKVNNQFTIPKTEPENSNSNGFVTQSQKSDEFEKDIANNAISYKYKTNIKLRFNQDLSAHEVPKRQKIIGGRRNSVTSFENQSSNHSSPPSSEPCTRIFDTENAMNRQTPPDIHQGHKADPPHSDSIQRLSPTLSSQTALSESNFNVPIFVLHTKGSYYIPLTIDYKTLRPYLQNYDIIESVQMQNIVLHPVTINVNFVNPNFNNGDHPRNNSNKYKYEYNNNWN
ncbi:transcription factor cwo isoform X2 [Anthonomus grandis grandis]|uniref:transcription factor cwo isoform X2 n=1 Tax=Anthonomus grandis grandis TaxID=2921223 RepID=UPI0021656108|nr:transcription factor cwo isoform X2 [Anthonomus grandis grandis]